MPLNYVLEKKFTGKKMSVLCSIGSRISNIFEISICLFSTTFCRSWTDFINIFENKVYSIILRCFQFLYILHLSFWIPTFNAYDYLYLLWMDTLNFQYLWLFSFLKHGVDSKYFFMIFKLHCQMWREFQTNYAVVK